MRDLFAPDPAPMLPLVFPQEELDGRIRRIRSPRYVDYEAGEAVLGRLAWLYDHPKVPRPPCSLIYSDTNNGKTALAYKFVRDHSPLEDSPDYGKRPVVYVHAPPYADLSGFYDSILRALNAPYRSTARSQAKWDQLLQLLNAVGTRVLILDEVNNFLVGKVDQRSMVLNSLKSLSNELKVPVVAMGPKTLSVSFKLISSLATGSNPSEFHAGRYLGSTLCLSPGTRRVWSLSATATSVLRSWSVASTECQKG